MTTELIGESGFVGTTLSETLTQQHVNLLFTPSSQVLDITDRDLVYKYIAMSPAEVVINCAAFTNVKLALENQDKAISVNIEGARNIAEACKRTKKFLIHFSTDGVFPITDEYKGPHSEDEIPVDDPNLISFYALTKLRGETAVLNSGVRTAIIRIAYPFGNANFPDKDYLVKLVKTIKAGYGLFSDQQLSATYIPSLIDIVMVLLEKKIPGIYHWVCQGSFSPFEVGNYLNDKLSLGLEIKKGSLTKLGRERGKQPYAKYGGLSTKLTLDRLKLRLPTWQKAIDDFTPRLREIL